MGARGEVPVRPFEAFLISLGVNAVHNAKPSC